MTDPDLAEHFAADIDTGELDDCICDALVDDADPDCPEHNRQPDDPAYREAKKRGEVKMITRLTDETETALAVLKVIKDAEAKERGEDDGHDGWCGCANCDEPDPAPMPCEGKVCNCHEITSLDPAPSIGSSASALAEGERIPAGWNLIEAGDGETYALIDPRDHYRWYPINPQNGWYTGRSDAEILALGPVRRAAVITLPDEHEWENVQVGNGTVHPGTSLGWASPADARDHAAVLLAAALHAEEGEK